MESAVPLNKEKEEDHRYCTMCGSGRDFSQAQYEQYFREAPLLCDCDAPIDDLWTAVRQTIEARDGWRTAKALGYKVCMFRVDLEPRRKTALDLTERGVPAEARILFITSQVDGFLIPVEADFRALDERLARNIREPDGRYPVSPIRSTLPKRLNLPHQIQLYAAEYGAGPHESCSADIVVGWLEADAREVATEPLISAFEALSVERDMAALLPANIAIEVKYESVLEKALRSKLASGVRDEEEADTLINAFMAGRAVDVARQTKLLLKAAGAPLPTTQMETKLNDLRKARNKMAHQGQLQYDLPPRTVAEYVCAAVFLVHYLNFAEPYLLGTTM